jgi:surfactin synthase thioesterase subunit
VTAARSTTWLQCAIPRTDARSRLICFAHAGGSASFFSRWGEQLEEYEVHAVRYPGRAERIAESPPSELRMLACDIADAIERLPGGPVALFGHSMGAVVALETARFLEARGVEVSHLFASGSRHGDCPDRSAEVTDDDDAVAARLVGLGGTDAELAGDVAFRELVLPYVRSDGSMFHAYVMRARPRVRCGITTIVGDADRDADQRPWRELTDGAFSERHVCGDHFYVIKAPPYAVLREVLQSCSRDNATPTLIEVISS